MKLEEPKIPIKDRTPMELRGITRTATGHTDALHSRDSSGASGTPH